MEGGMAMKWKKTVIIPILTAVIFLWGSGIVSAQTKALIQDSVLTKALDKGVLSVGTNLGYVPFEMMDEQGNAIGFDIDLARLVAEKLGVKLDLVIVDWQGLLTGLQLGKYDLVICGLGRTLERAKKIAFTHPPYYAIGQSALISNKRLPNIKDINQLNNPDVTIAVMQGTTGHLAAERLLSKAKIKQLTEREEAAMLVAQGRVDAMLFDQPLIRFYTYKYPKRTYMPDQVLTYEPLGFALRWGDPMWFGWLNLFCDQLVSGAYMTVDEETLKKYELDPKFLGHSIYEGLKHKWFEVWMSQQVEKLGK
jgi:polar amino acid transport system substrate-binding protein